MSIQTAMQTRETMEIWIENKEIYFKSVVSFLSSFLVVGF